MTVANSSYLGQVLDFGDDQDGEFFGEPMAEKISIDLTATFIETETKLEANIDYYNHNHFYLPTKKRKFIASNYSLFVSA